MGKKGTTVMPGVYNKLKGRTESSKLLGLKKKSPMKQQKLRKGMPRMKNNMY